MALQLTDRLLAGKPYPLGAHWDGLGVNFAVFSANAARIDLCLFSASGRKELSRMPLPECTDEIWHGYLPNAALGTLYAYRAYGPYDPAHGHRFNPHKLLLDPYARQLSGPVRWSDALFGYRLQSARGDLTPDRRDSAPNMPKAIVVDESFHWGDDRPPDVPWPDTVLYETHLRGVSMLREEVLPHLRGTFAALADPRFLDHLLRLGVTAVELLPVHAILQDRFLLERGLRNYWGYNTLSYFAPEPSYLATDQLLELKVAVRRLHAAGIEVILDVVYNHTCEGNELGPTVSWRGLDNASYYHLVPGDERHYVNDTGCGNMLNLSHPRVLQMVLDSLRYWVECYHVDGFRFDLGTTLGREHNGFDPGAAFFDAVLQDPVLSRVKLISEPWDLGPGGYQLGNQPPGFAEWNDKFRDTVRRYWRGDPGQRGELAARLAGSADLFDRRHRRPWSSINFITSHDGFTLADLVSYNTKHNEANGEDNRDGTDQNHSANWSPDGSVEGPTDDAAILALRARVSHAMMATLLLAQGTPMLTAGDESGRSQGGNNNAYCQDNALSWLDWKQALTPQGQTLLQIVRRLLALRRRLYAADAHRFAHGNHEPLPGIGDIAWFDTDGQPPGPEAWADPDVRTLALRRAERLEAFRRPVRGGQASPVQVTLMLLNAGDNDAVFHLPEPALDWQLLFDSSQPDLPEAGLPVAGVAVQAVPAHALVVLAAQAEPPPPARPATPPRAPLQEPDA
ncbi:glycogen debranching protein GlgX [Cupriavidus sp. WKF15]|uniref:glycogen debranching protein GlgX n=1 Tax=Cupriavidus sp. WKF15 TaxID=3032282 RepID=UPI0023E2178E|nr:glycogen debranching protein GlgX [Cupriavidus sp. WKF15]WER48524.1 glycogen debranching protein GlgX [Cupriavidus sp. WKF15]